MTDTLGKVRSSIHGMVWSALPAGPGALLLSLQLQLDQTQWWPAAELQRRQPGQLADSLRQAYEHVPFHRERLEAAGYEPGGELSLFEMTVSEVAEIPRSASRKFEDFVSRIAG